MSPTALPQEAAVRGAIGTIGPEQPAVPNRRVLALMLIVITSTHMPVTRSARYSRPGGGRGIHKKSARGLRFAFAAELKSTAYGKRECNWGGVGGSDHFP